MREDTNAHDVLRCMWKDTSVVQENTNMCTCGKKLAQCYTNMCLCEGKHQCVCVCISNRVSLFLCGLLYSNLVFGLVSSLWVGGCVCVGVCHALCVCVCVCALPCLFSNLISNLWVGECVCVCALPYLISNLPKTCYLVSNLLCVTMFPNLLPLILLLLWSLLPST